MTNKIVNKATTITFTPMELLSVLSGLSYIEEDEERHELDRKDATKLKERIVKEIDNQSIEVASWKATLDRKE